MPKDELIAALEKATGADRELDVLIALATGWTEYNADWFTPPNLTVKHHRSELPRYTADMNAALALIPEGWRPYTADFSIRGRARWSLEGPKTQWETDENGDQGPGDDWFAQGIGRTIATAIVIAALRATERGEAGR